MPFLDMTSLEGKYDLGASTVSVVDFLADSTAKSDFTGGTCDTDASDTALPDFLGGSSVASDLTGLNCGLTTSGGDLLDALKDSIDIYDFTGAMYDPPKESSFILDPLRPKDPTEEQLSSEESLMPENDFLLSATEAPSEGITFPFLTSGKDVFHPSIEPFFNPSVPKEERDGLDLYIASWSSFSRSRELRR